MSIPVQQPSSKWRSRAVAALAAAGWLGGCGMEPLKKLDAEGAKVVTLATAGQIAKTDVVPNSYIVTFRADQGSSLRGFATFAEEFAHHYAYLSETFLTDPRVTDLQFITTMNLANPRNPQLAADLNPPPELQLMWNDASVSEVPGAIARVDFVDQASAASALAEWEAAKQIWFAEPNYVNRLMDRVPPRRLKQGGSPYTQQLADGYKTLAQDPEQRGWWQQSIKLPDALAKLAAATNLSSVQAPVIAVLDSGLDVQHPALTANNNIWSNPSPGASGCPGDVNGCDTTTAFKGTLGSGNIAPYLTSGPNQACPDPGASAGGASLVDADDADVCSHGTHVAGIIAAALDQNNGIGGVCPVCKIMPIKIISTINGAGAASDAAILAAFKYLSLFRTNVGLVRVANSSFGKYVRARSVALIVSVLAQSPNEVLVVGAAGNENSMVRSYPAALGPAMSVAALGVADEKATYSNFGPWVKISAPGGDGEPKVTSTIPGGTVGEKQGTSMACPVIAGVAGLVLSIDPNRSWQALHDSLMLTADPRIYDPSVNNGYNYNFYDPKLQNDASRHPMLGAGVVDASAALDGTAHTGNLGPTVSRVGPGCGVAGEPAGRGGGWAMLLAFAMLGAPVLIGISRAGGEA